MPFSGTLGRRWTLSFQDVVSNGPADNGNGQTAACVGQWPESVTETIPEPKNGQAGQVPEALQVRNLSKTFRSGFLRRQERGISEVSFSVTQGTVFALLGHNGAGKTTTINCILDLVHAGSGKVEILGVDHRDPKARTQVGFLPERPYFFEHLTGLELLGFYADLLGIAGDQKDSSINSVLERTGMTNAAGRRLRKYSKGMLQRIGLAQALLGDPQLLILDEPMSGLDPMGRREVRELLLELKAQGKTIILSSHIVPDVEMLADSIGILREGSLVMTRKLDEMTRGESYEVRLQDTSARNGTRTLTVENVGALRELLDRCHADGIPVAAVETHRSGLEDLFLEAHQSKVVA